MGPTYPIFELEKCFWLANLKVCLWQLKNFDVFTGKVVNYPILWLDHIQGILVTLMKNLSVLTGYVSCYKRHNIDIVYRSYSQKTFNQSLDHRECQYWRRGPILWLDHLQGILVTLLKNSGVLTGKVPSYKRHNIGILYRSYSQKHSIRV